MDFKCAAERGRKKGRKGRNGRRETASAEKRGGAGGRFQRFRQSEEAASMGLIVPHAKWPLPLVRGKLGRTASAKGGLSLSTRARQVRGMAVQDPLEIE